MTEKLIPHLTIVVYCFIGLALLIGIIRYRKLGSDQRLLVLLLIITAIVELTSRILWTLKANNMPLFHVFAIVEVLILLSIYRLNFDSPPIKNTIQYVKIALGVFAVINVAFLQKLTTFNSNALTLNSVVLICCGVGYFYQLLRNITIEHLEKNPMFWINVGVLVYFSSSIILFHVSNRLIPEDLVTRGVAWGIHAIFNAFHYLAFAIALWMKPAP